jgi:hypothetical protein
VHFKYKNDERPLQTPEMWNSRLMAVPQGVQKPESMTEFPIFDLDHIGVVRGLRPRSAIGGSKLRSHGSCSS